jgi:hypothetical protein
MILKAITGLVLPAVAKWLTGPEPQPPQLIVPSRTVERTALLTASPLFIAAGSAAWVLVTRQLKAQNIRVHPDSPSLVGKPVAGPVTAFTQAAVIEKHALDMGSGRTFAEISEEWMEATRRGDTERAEELAGPRQMVMQANFLRASLFTSVLAYGLSALTAGVGVLAAVVGTALRPPRLTAR